MFLTEEGKDYKEEARALAWNKLEPVIMATGRSFLDKPGDLIVEFRVFTPDKRKRDADNLFKLSLDAIADGLGVDDSRFLPRIMSRALDRKNPRIEVRIYRKEETDVD